MQGGKGYPGAGYLTLQLIHRAIQEGGYKWIDHGFDLREAAEN